MQNQHSTTNSIGSLLQLMLSDLFQDLSGDIIQQFNNFGKDRKHQKDSQILPYFGKVPSLSNSASQKISNGNWWV